MKVKSTRPRRRRRCSVIRPNRKKTYVSCVCSSACMLVCCCIVRRRRRHRSLMLMNHLTTQCVAHACESIREYARTIYVMCVCVCLFTPIIMLCLRVGRACACRLCSALSTEDDGTPSTRKRLKMARLQRDERRVRDDPLEIRIDLCTTVASRFRFLGGRCVGSGMRQTPNSASV